MDAFGGLYKEARDYRSESDFELVDATPFVDIDIPEGPKMGVIAWASSLSVAAEQIAKIERARSIIDNPHKTKEEKDHAGRTRTASGGNLRKIAAKLNDSESVGGDEKLIRDEELQIAESLLGLGSYRLRDIARAAIKAQTPPKEPV